MTKYSIKRSTFILKCFLQFTYTNLDGFRKRGVTFEICFRKRGYPERGVPLKKKRRGGSNPGGNYVHWAGKCPHQNEFVNIFEAEDSESEISDSEEVNIVLLTDSD